jgi:tyrosinase
MPKKPYESWHVSRREFLTTTAAAIGSAAIPYSGATAQGAARWRRINLSDPNTPQAQKEKVLGSYKKAIRAMLARKPEDPLNWYRNALVHTVDCPHGNWWFLPWHRGYIGLFEKKCRLLSEDQDFALPYWDWTMQQKVPPEIFDGVLDPNNDAFIGTHNELKNKFTDTVKGLDYWKLNPDGTPTDRYHDVLARGYRFPDDLWFDIIDTPPWPTPTDFNRCFFDRPNARGLTKDKPFFDKDTTYAVSSQTIDKALRPTDFLTFASPKAAGGHNVQIVGFGVLEASPHNLVHNCVGGTCNNNSGGFMLNFLSPVDPIFFLHHANIDRLWDVWTRKQMAFGYPALPVGDDLARWSREKFNFFVDEIGTSVKATAGDYAKIGDFNYDYQPGTGEEVIHAPAIAAAPGAAKVGPVSATITAPVLSATQAAGGTVRISQELLQAATKPGGPELIAKVTVAFPPMGHVPFTILIGAPADAKDVGPSSPHFAGTFAMFGSQVMHGPLTFTVPVSANISKLQASNQLAADQSLDIRVIPSATPHAALAAAAAPSAEIVSIVVEAH